MSGNEPILDLTCPDCGANQIIETWREQSFQYGSGEAAVNLRAQLPVMECLTCAFAYTDDRGEEARHNAVCNHLGVLTPRQIVDIRQRLGLNRSEFAGLIGCGIASLQRWESGSLIQNVSSDRLIRLMQFTSNAEFLRGIGLKDTISVISVKAGSSLTASNRGSDERRPCRDNIRAFNPRQLAAAKVWRLRG